MVPQTFQTGTVWTWAGLATTQITVFQTYRFSDCKIGFIDPRLYVGEASVDRAATGGGVSRTQQRAAVSQPQQDAITGGVSHLQR